MFQALQQHPGGLLPYLLLVEADGGQTGLHHLARPVISDTGKADVLPYFASGSAQHLQRTKGHSVGHADHTVQLRAARQQLLHAAVPLFHGKGGAAGAGQTVRI